MRDGTITRLSNGPTDVWERARAKNPLRSLVLLFFPSVCCCFCLAVSYTRTTHLVLLILVASVDRILFVCPVPVYRCPVCFSFVPSRNFFFKEPNNDLMRRVLVEKNRYMLCWCAEHVPVLFRVVFPTWRKTIIDRLLEFFPNKKSIVWANWKYLEVTKLMT